MANVYVDLDKAASTEDGTSWANAYRLPSEITVASGDDVWIKGNTNAHSGSAIAITFGTDAQNPAKLHGVKSATSAEPPTSSDLIPGLRTGEARTVANRAYKDADRPVIAVSTSHNLHHSGHFFAYGIEFQSGAGIRPGNLSNDTQEYQECLFNLAGTGGNFRNPADSLAYVELKNCGLETNNAGHKYIPSGNSRDIGLEYIGSTVSTGGLFAPTRSYIEIIGADLTDLGANAVVDLNSQGAHARFLNCTLGASFTLSTGAVGDQWFRFEFAQCDDTTGKSSGTLVGLDILTNTGNIAEETTAVRTGGANDGSSNWAYAFTPIANGTRDNYNGLVGPWMAFEVLSTDTQVDVHIANSGAGDYQDDEVALELMIPSEDGTAQFTFLTTQADLLGTPANILDDTGSTWGTGANNHQILRQAIAPDYDGLAYCRVIDYKNFSSSPETLYVDPLPVVT